MPSRPNILLITSDQQHHDTLGATNPRIRTPALDRLCREGTRFERAYCPNPLCTPSRASILTGQYPSRHGAWTIGVKLPEQAPTLGGYLRGAGYRTALVGKAHLQPLATQPGSTSIECQPTLRDLDFWRAFRGPWYGFDEVELARNHADESHVGQHYALWLEAQGLADWREYFQPLPGDTSSKAPATNPSVGYWARHERSWRLPEPLHYSRWTAERSTAFVERCAEADQPFFLWASFHDPHPPYTVPEPWASLYDPADMEVGRLLPGEHDANPPHFAATQEERPDFSDWHRPFPAHGCESHRYPEGELRKDVATYYGMISLMDQQIGRILDRLDALELADDTLVVFSSDHGHFLGQHGLVAKGPFHYEDLLRVPFVVRWPGRVPQGRTSAALQSLVDLTPTLLTAAGLPTPPAMQGVDQGAMWRGERDAARDHILCENRHNPVMPHLTTYVDERYKLTVYREGDHGELFDLRDDPGEHRNLWRDPDAAPLKLALMHALIQASLRSEPTVMPRIATA